MSPDASRFTQIDLADISFSATAALWEGGKHAGTDTSIFVVRTPPGGFVELHTHPYSETFVILRGRGRWTAGDQVIEPDVASSRTQEDFSVARNLAMVLSEFAQAGISASVHPQRP